MNILALLNLWLGRALISRGLGAPGTTPAVFVIPCPRLQSAPIEDTIISTAPIVDVTLESTPIQDTHMSTTIGC